MTGTQKLILVIFIVLVVVVLLIKFLPKANTNTNTNTNNSGSGSTGSGTDNSGNGNGTPTSGTRNYDAATFKVGDLMYATKDFYAVCTSCILPNWLCLLHDCYPWTAGQAFGNFVSLDGSTITFTNGGYTYTVLLGDARPYVVR